MLIFLERGDYMAVDGSIVFNTKMDTDGISKGTKEISSKMLDLKNKISNTESEIASLRQELEKMADTPINTNAAANLEKDIAKAKSQLRSLYEQADQIGNTKQSDLTSMGFDTKYLDAMLAQDSSWQKVQKQIDETEAKLKNYERTLKQVRAAESQVTGKDTAAYQQKQQRLQKLSGQLNVYKARLRETEAKEKSSSNATSKSISAFNRLKKVLSTVGKTLSSAFKKGAVNMIKKIGSNAKKSASQMGGLSKSFNMIKQALSGIIIYQGLFKMFNSIKEGMQNLAQVSPETNQSLSMVMSALTRLKNSFATAFAPILNVVAPILTTFINMLSSAADKIAQFMSVLTGKSTYTKAVAVQQDYAASISDTTQATEENTKATQENQKNLAGYDELNVMQQGTSSSANNSDGNKNELAPSDMFTTAAVSNGVSNFANQLKSLFKKQDFEGIGKLIGTKINNALQSIDWESIRNTAKTWATNIANFLNGALFGIDWTLVGTTFGNGLMTLFDFAYTFLTTFDFTQLGMSIANVLNGLFTSMDWTTVGGTFGAVIQSIISTGFGFVTTFDWLTAGLSLSNAINGFFAEIDWVMAAQTISEGLKGLLATITTFSANTDWEQIGMDIGTFIANIDWLGIFTSVVNMLGSAINGAFDLFLGLLKGLGLADWLKDNLGIDLEEIIKGIQKAFGGLIDFITGIFSGDWEKAWQGICDFFSGIWDAIWSIVKSVVNLIIDGINMLWSGIYSAVKGIINGIGGIAGAIGDIFGQDWHFSMPEEPPLIPKLATGTVVPANYGEFLAVLGDNKREAEVVSPLSTMKRAFLEALAEGNFTSSDNDINLTINLDGKVIYQNIVKQNDEFKKTHGYSQLA